MCWEGREARRGQMRRSSSRRSPARPFAALASAEYTDPRSAARVHGLPDRQAMLVVAVGPQLPGCKPDRLGDDALGARVLTGQRTRHRVAREPVLLGELGEIGPAQLKLELDPG